MEEREALAAARGEEHGSVGTLTVPAARPRVGIVGAGFIGAVHARSARLAGGTLAGVATSTPERSREAAARLGAERAYATPHDLVAADDVDVVHICSPNATHAELATRALEHGKHVVCEKPLAVSTEEADGARRRARAAAGRIGTVPFVYRFHPVVREARARVRSGSLGPVRLITGGYLQDWLASAEDDNWRVDAAQGGPSRAFADIGSHWCDLVEFITGERITAICAQTSTIFGERADGGAARAFDADGGGADGATARGDHRGRGHRRLPHGFRRPRHVGGLPGLARPQEPPAPRDRLRRGERPLRAGAPRDALARPPRHLGDRSRATRASSARRPRRTRSRPRATRRATSIVSTFSSRTHTLPCAAGRRRRGFRRSRTARGART